MNRSRINNRHFASGSTTAMRGHKKYTWHKIADSAEALFFNEKGLLQTAVAGKTICIAKSADTLMACTAKCPHAGGTMEDGFIDAGGNIVCPLHGYKYSLQSGRNVSGEGYFLKTYPVESRKDGVFVGIDENNLFSWLK